MTLWTPEQQRASTMTWRDITAECEILGGYLWHDGEEIKWPMNPARYRLTKISGPLQPHVAFIVEKRE